MSTPSDCIPCGCTTPVTVNTPGSPGAQGPAGTNGTNGINAFTVTAANFLTPALSGSVTIQVASSAWAVVGQAIAIANGTAVSDTYVVTAIPDSTHLTITYENYGTNVNTGNTVNSGSGVSPSGFQPGITNPLPIANGGTNATTKAAAQTSLGLGQNALVSTVSGLTQAVTAGYLQVGACAVTVTAAGSYLFSGFVTVDWAGVTFASNRIVSVKLRNTTQGVDLATGTWNTQTPTTTGYPSSDLHVPFVLYAGAAVNDVIQILITVNTINSAGTFQSIGASITGIPLRLT